MFSQVPFKGKVGQRASPGRKKNPGAKHMGVKDFTPTTAPTLPKKLINSILGMLWGWGTQEDQNLILRRDSDHTLLPDTTG